MNRAWKFVVATIVVSWSAVGIYVGLGGVWTGIGATIFATGYMFVPVCVAVVLAAREEERSIADRLGLNFRFNWWWLSASLFPIVIAIAALGVALLFPQVTFTTGIEGMIARYGEMLSDQQVAQMRKSLDQLPVHPFWLAIPQALVAGVTINGLAAFGEEAGWRGFLYDEWRGLGFWEYSASVGAIWGIWHAPLILLGHNYPDHPVVGVGMMVGFCLLYSPIFTFVRDRAGSTIAAAILHGTINASIGLALIPLDGGSDLLVGLTGAAGFIVLAVAGFGVWLARRLRPVWREDATPG